jgi:hypothetical protein
MPKTSFSEISIPPPPVFIHKEETQSPIKQSIDLNIKPPQPKISEIKAPPPPPPKVQIEIGGVKPKIKNVNYFDIPQPPQPPQPSLKEQAGLNQPQPQQDLQKTPPPPPLNK